MFSVLRFLHFAICNPKRVLFSASANVHFSFSFFRSFGVHNLSMFVVFGILFVYITTRL